MDDLTRTMSRILLIATPADEYEKGLTDLNVMLISAGLFYA